MSVSISIDKTKLVDAIASDVCARCGGGGVSGCLVDYSIPGDRTGNVNVYCTGGWLRYVVDTTGIYPKLETMPPYHPYADIEGTQVVIVIGFYRLRQITSIYLHFNEPAPGYANLVEGFHTEGNQIVVRSPEQPTPVGNYGTSMEVTTDDIVFLANIWINENGTIYNKFVGGKIDYDTLEVQKVIDAWTQPQQPWRWRYFVLVEADGARADVLVGPYTIWWTQTRYVTHDTDFNAAGLAGLLRSYKNMGLIDPRTV